MGSGSRGTKSRTYSSTIHAALTLSIVELRRGDCSFVELQNVYMYTLVLKSDWTPLPSDFVCCNLNGLMPRLPSKPLCFGNTLFKQIGCNKFLKMVCCWVNLE